MNKKTKDRLRKILGIPLDDSEFNIKDTSCPTQEDRDTAGRILKNYNELSEDGSGYQNVTFYRSDAKVTYYQYSVIYKSAKLIR